MPVLSAALAALASIVLVHDWYPNSCCGGTDCKPIACDQLVEARGGWLYLPTGNYFHEAQVQPSPDRNCHVCISNGGDHRSLCAFVQFGT